MRFYVIIFFLILFGAVTKKVSAQNVNVAGALVGNGSYATLNAAFTAIGTAQLGANINISIVGNTVEGVSATLGNGNWATVNISPSGGGARTIVGSIIGGLITLNGADNVTINGLNSGGNSLSIINQSTNALASTIKLWQDAQGNTITNCTIQGSSTGAYNNAEGATVLFSTTASGIGNDNNTVSNNDIGPAGVNLPYQAVKSYGSATRENSNNSITGNLIHDFFSASTSMSNSKGIVAQLYSTTFTITNNRIYQTATRTWGSGGSGVLENIYACIDIWSGFGYTISGNIIGFANSTGTGYTTLTTTLANNYASMIHAITLSHSAAASSTISNNTIGGFDLTSSRAKTTAGENIFLGIYLKNGTINANISGNTIGSATGINSILIRSTAISAGIPVPAVGIYAKATGTNVISNNTIGGIAMSFSAPGTAGSDNFSLVGILNEGNGNVTIQGNTVGGSIAGSITSSHLLGSVIGISNSSAVLQVRIQGNTIRNLRHTGANLGIGTSSSVIGILEKIGAGTFANIIHGNLINNLSNAFVSGAAVIHVKGIVSNPFNSTSVTTIERNAIHTLSVTSTAVGSSINGINLIANGTANVFNNMISLGDGLTGNLKIVGIKQDGMTTFAYHNSIRILGTITSGTDSSACYSYTNPSITFRSKNNIFHNQRSGGGGKHYAFHARYIPPGYLASHNVIYSATATYAIYNNIAYANLATLFAGSGQDDPLTSKSVPIVFTSNTDLHTFDLNVRNEGLSPLTPAVTLDIDSVLRPGCVDIGCDEVDPVSIPGTAFTWIGNLDTKWCEACNWDREAVPASTDDVIIADSLTRYPLLEAGTLLGNPCDNVTVHDFAIQQNVNPLKSGTIDLATYTLSVTGDVSIAGTCTCTGSTAFTALNTGLIDLTGTTQSQSVDIRGSDGSYPGTICKLRVNKTQPTGIASANHEAYLRGNLIILYNLDFANGVLLSKTAATFDADELTAINYKTISIQSDETSAVTRQSIGAQNTRNGFFQGRLNRKIKSGAGANEYLFPLGFRLTGGSGVLGNYFYTPALLKNNSIANNQYLTGTYLHDQNNPTADGVAIGFTGHGCMNALEIDDQGGATASTCNNKEIDMLSTFYWDFQESTGPAANGDPVTVTGALGAVNYDLQTGGDVYTMLAQDGLTGSELRMLRRPSVIIPGNAGQGVFVTTAGTHNGVDISANTGIAQYSIVAASLQGARRDGLTTFGGFASAGNGPSPLPVELLYFHAERSGEKNVLCTWETATEINNDHFEIEAARDHGGELVFETIGSVQGSGTSSQNHSYSFVDEHPKTGKNYYRLRQVDFDGTAGYSKMVVVQFNTGKKFEVLASSPNPFLAYPVLYVQSELGGPLLVQVENSIGQIVFKQELVLSRGSSSLVLDLPAELSSGLYFVRTLFDDGQQVSRLLKQ